MVKPAVRRQAVGFIRAEFALSERAACRALGSPGPSHRYESCRPEPTDLVAKLKAIAARRPRFGYRRLHVMLRREGLAVNHKRVYRLYGKEGLTVRSKRRRRMTAATRTVLAPAASVNQRWRMERRECRRKAVPGLRCGRRLLPLLRRA